MTETGQLRLVHEETTRLVIGSAMDVSNTLGHGLLENIYENALCVEFELRQIPFEQQQRFKVQYKARAIGDYIPDLVVDGRVVVDTKTIERIGDHEIGQVINYLRITGMKVGLILNFKRPKLEWKRVVL